ncbi:MAG: tetratricopeptide repeat protein [Ignavibacteriaceae bacterium]|nr:tetratricopeptide repeat protein [Ignavibacteria bacterium]MBT8390851.1 tetratricopeptide repeat protein [Ignavibacteria bacterium]NNJ53952.1 tetratricopeptide repeat protein [Ignavibacteriaceae bacterium]NNL21233.1 tetratricopeptide repeat protein [Ignavibacteriaceae bacterium]
MKQKIMFSTVVIFLLSYALITAQEMNVEAGKLYNEGNSLLKAGNYSGAIESYDKALAIEKDYRMYYQKGVAQKKSRDLEGAKNSFEESLKLNNGFEGGYNALGGVYFSMGNYLEAINNFEKVLASTKKASVKKKVKKNISLAYAKLGNNEMSNGNSQKAIEYLAKSVENSDYDAAYLSLAKLYSEIGEFDKSINASEKALKHRSKISRGGPYYYMGISYKGKGDMVKAKEMFEKAKGDATYRKTAEYELSLIN